MYSQCKHSYHQVTILSGATQSTAIDITHQTIVGFRYPAAFTGTSISVQEGTNTSGTFNTVIDPTTGADISVAAAAGKTATIAPQALACVQYARVTSNAAEGADRVVTVITRPAV
jgi:hypothetical protein